MVLGQQARDFLVRGDPVHGDHGCRHDVPDPVVPAPMMLLGATCGLVLPGGLPGGLPGRLRGARGGVVAGVLLDGVKGPGHIRRAGPAVQRLVVGGAKVTEHSVQMIISPGHISAPFLEIGCWGSQYSDMIIFSEEGPSPSLLYVLGLEDLRHHQGPGGVRQEPGCAGRPSPGRACGGARLRTRPAFSGPGSSCRGTRAGSGRADGPGPPARR